MPSWKPPAWRLPAGVSPGLWEYLQSETVAQNYERYLVDSPLPGIDQGFLDEHLRDGGRVVDLGCGTGRSMLHLAARGCECVGVDLSGPMLIAAAGRFRASGLPVTLIRANVVELDCLKDGAFDYALCLFSTLGMIRGRAERRRALSHAARVLRPGGRLILHVHNRWSNLWQSGARGGLLRDLVSTWGSTHAPGDRYMPPHQGVANLYSHLYTWSELVSDLHAAGLRVIVRRLIGPGANGQVCWPWCFGRLRALGYLVVARKT